MTVILYDKEYECKSFFYNVVRVEVEERKYIIIRRTITGQDFSADYSKRQYKLCEIVE